MKTLCDLLQTSATKHGQRTALEIRVGFRAESWTYADLQSFSEGLACYLQRRGIAHGDRVVLCAPNHPHWVGAFFACLACGAVVVPLDVQSSPDFVARVVNATEPKLIFAHQMTVQLLQDLRVDTLFLEDLPEIAGEGQGGPASRVLVDPQDVAEIVFTSGTTGDPKGVMLTHQNILSNVAAGAQLIPGRPSYKLLSLLPLSHMLEQSAGLLMPLRAGARIIHTSSRQSGVIARILRDEGVTTMVAVPQLLSLLINGIEREARRLGQEARWARAHALARHLPMFARRWLFRSALRRLGGKLEFIVCGGSYLGPHLAQKWENLGVSIIQGYGATEASPSISSNSLKKRRLDSVGQVLPGQEVRIASDQEILARGPNIFRGYWGNKEASREALEDGWYHTGDLGYLDQDGYLYFKGRKKNLIVLADGRNVYPEDIEPVLNEELDREAGEEAVILGFNREGGVAQVHAVLLVREQSTAAEAVRRTNHQLAEHQRITGFTIWPQGDFPRTRTLRVKRDLVVEYLASNLEKSVSGGPATVRESESPNVPASTVRRILAELCSLSADQIRDEARLIEDLNVDSLGRVELLSAIEAELGVYIDEQELGPQTTVAGLEQLVSQPAGTAPPVTLRRWPLTLPARLLRRSLQSLFLFPALWLLARPRVAGRENLKGLRGPVIFAANHSSHLDSPTVLYSLPADWRNQAAVAAAEEYFFQSRFLSAITTLLINGFPFARQGSIRPSLELCGKLLDRGWSILIYPEGTRSTSGEIGPFKSGTGLLAVELQAPVVPIKLVGLDRVLPKGRSIPRPGRVEARIGKPLFFGSDVQYSGATQTIEEALKSL